MKILLKAIAFAGLIAAFASPALANCVMPDSQGPQDFMVMQYWDITHVNDKNATGCLAKLSDGSSEERLVYTPYSFICKLPAEEKISLSLESSCCDTGRQGDYPCGIIPLDGLPDTTQTSLTAVPAKPDRRAIPDLVVKLAGGEIYGIHSAAEKLAEYARNDDFRKDVRAYEAQLLKIHNASGSAIQKQAIATVLLSLGGDKEGEQDLNLLLSSLSGAGVYLDAQQKEALALIGKHPEFAQKSMPVLIRLLQWLNEPKPVMETIQKLGAAAVAPYFRDIAGAIDLATLTEAQDPEASLKTFTRAIPAAKDEKEAARQHAMVEQKRAELEAAASKADELLPLWRKIVCGHYPDRKGRVEWDRYNQFPPVDCGK